jgi:hypothetical protein
MHVDREQALDTALGQIERNFGKGAVMRMSDQAQVSVGAISTGSLPLDLALGIGGAPRPAQIFGQSIEPTLVRHREKAQRRGRRHLRSSTPSARWTPLRQADRRQHRRAARLGPTPASRRSRSPSPSLGRGIGDAIDRSPRAAPRADQDREIPAHTSASRPAGRRRSESSPRSILPRDDHLHQPGSLKTA